MKGIEPSIKMLSGSGVKRKFISFGLKISEPRGLLRSQPLTPDFMK